METRSCLECGKSVYGRSDKKFCDDTCRNAYNNRQNADANNFVRNVHNLLRRNRRILEELNPEGKGETTRTQLLTKGFDFTYHTSTMTTKAGISSFFCYEYGYQMLDDERVKLIKDEQNTYA